MACLALAVTQSRGLTAQIAAALAAGNAVLAKPAEQTPLVAAEAIRLLHQAGVPSSALQFVPGYGDVGAALTGDRSVAGVAFTGSTEVGRIINRALAAKDGPIVPLIAETGGQNALVVDSSALAEQVVADQQALREIENEERVHTWLIHTARTYLPEPEDISSIRRRTRRLFMRVASRDIATHFARITGLDSGVCISLSALLGSRKVNNIQGFARLIKQIRRDEATHVKKSRDHAVGLGFDADCFHDCYDLTRTGMVDMLTPIASSFDDLKVDPDRLFKRLLRFQGNRMPGSADLED